MAWAPAALAVEGMLIARSIIDVRSLRNRVFVILFLGAIPALLLGALTPHVSMRFLMSDTLGAGLRSALVALLLFPIFEVFRPYLRPHRDRLWG